MNMKRPIWLNKKVRWNEADSMAHFMKEQVLHTVCQEARCPNRSECFSRKTAAFLILGDLCTRNCTFCAVKHGVPLPFSKEEPLRVARAVKIMGIRYAVITSVTRDDLADGGAKAFAETIRAVRIEGKAERVEVLVPDFQGDEDAADTVLRALPDVFAHNVETVPRLYPEVRPEADYQRSLAFLAGAKKRFPSQCTKSGLMVGLGERVEEVESVIRELRKAGTSFLSIGQYLSPGSAWYPVKEYVHPSLFEHYRKVALEAGFESVMSGPYVRSSYMAETYFDKVQ